ncbi:MAG TPA: TIGR03618 family F420-dependent PPOX class oxidoreductase [Chloroflexota bacterium]
MSMPLAELEMIKQFAAQTTRAVLVTRRKDDGLQSSPMSVIADEDGNVLTATRARNAKIYNLARDPRVTLCLFTEKWPGPWMHVEGDAHITRLPDAMPLLAAYYARRGQDTSTDHFRQRMIDENRVLIRITPRRVVQRA